MSVNLYTFPVSDDLSVYCVHRDGVPLFAVREFDSKIIRSPGRQKKRSSEQAMRAAIRQAIVNLNLRSERATKAEIKQLKTAGILGKRAPSAALLGAADMCRLLKAFGKEDEVVNLKNALRREPRFQAAADLLDENLDVVPITTPSILNRDSGDDEDAGSSPTQVTFSPPKPRARKAPRLPDHDSDEEPAPKRMTRKRRAIAPPTAAAPVMSATAAAPTAGLDALLSALETVSSVPKPAQPGAAASVMPRPVALSSPLPPSLASVLGPFPAHSTVRSALPISSITSSSLPTPPLSARALSVTTTLQLDRPAASQQPLTPIFSPANTLASPVPAASPTSSLSVVPTPTASSSSSSSSASSSSSSSSSSFMFAPAYTALPTTSAASAAAPQSAVTSANPAPELPLPPMVEVEDASSFPMPADINIPADMMVVVVGSQGAAAAVESS